MITTAEIRQRYIDFFAQREHKIVASAPLAPPDDPTLMFTSAGMVQFKALYTGQRELPYRRAVTVQKCLRAGGKGSDLENVGRTLRHHTFFEMLGNFSFGDYFKQEAIRWAWEFCTGKEWLALPPERIWPTVFGKRDADGQWEVDEEAERFWREETGAVNPVIRLDEVENFWGPAGGTGACGPCSEIKFFMGSDRELEEYQKLARSGEDGLDKVARDHVEKGDLFLEIWNLVFPQYDQQPDGSRPPLKNRGIDTGAGLERMTTACQMIASGGKIRSPYETDSIAPIVQVVSDIAGTPYPKLRGGEQAEADLREKGLDPAEARLAINACADHARALTFAIAEGIVPSNEERGYVIRRILRRAARFGKKIGIDEPFLWRLVDPVVEVMGEVYPELKADPDQIKKTIRLDEEQFSRTLNVGSEVLDQVLAGLDPGSRLGGEDAFRLYDTYGFPLDLTLEVCEERGFTVDVEGYERYLREGRKRSKTEGAKADGLPDESHIRELRQAGLQTEFSGYAEAESEGTIIRLIDEAGKSVQILLDNEQGWVVLDRTPFYGEAGGQIGDEGVMVDAKGEELFQVGDTQKSDEGFVFHSGRAERPIALGDEVVAKIDARRRQYTIKNHSATHLLQGALKRLVGAHITQAGSYVGPNHLRFDFTTPEAIGEETLSEVARLVNDQIQNNLPVTTDVMSLEEARATGAIAPFGEKYGATVRVVRMGEFSTEFCGGNHVKATGEIGTFIILSESSVASGVRRIEAQTGLPAAQTVAEERMILHHLSRSLAITPGQLPGRISALLGEIKELRRLVERAKSQELASEATGLKIVKVGDKSACVAWLEDSGIGDLRSTFDTLKAKQNNEKFIAVLGSGSNGKATLIVGATPDLAGTNFEAGKLVKDLAPLFNGRGGGKAQFAQAGGKDAAQLKQVINEGIVLDLLRSRDA